MTQEPRRNNVLKSLTKLLSIANRKTFLHRMIYIIQCNNNLKMDFDDWKDITKSWDDKNEDSLNGVCLHTFDYVICILEGSEDNLNKHIAKLVKRNVVANFKTKILIMMPHILKRYFVDWQNISVQPPTLLDNLNTTMNPDQHASRVKHCVLKLLKLSEYLSNRFEGDPNNTLENISESCKNVIPEAALLESMIDSPLLLPMEMYHENFTSPHPYQLYHDVVWPSAPTFIPTNISKRLGNN